jgi:hypothetical protein
VAAPIVRPDDGPVPGRIAVPARDRWPRLRSPRWAPDQMDELCCRRDGGKAHRPAQRSVRWSQPPERQGFVSAPLEDGRQFLTRRWLSARREVAMNGPVRHGHQQFVLVLLDKDDLPVHGPPANSAGRPSCAIASACSPRLTGGRPVGKTSVSLAERLLAHGYRRPDRDGRGIRSVTDRRSLTESSRGTLSPSAVVRSSDSRRWAGPSVPNAVERDRLETAGARSNCRAALRTAPNRRQPSRTASPR